MPNPSLKLTREGSFCPMTPPRFQGIKGRQLGCMDMAVLPGGLESCHTGYREI
jgi:hypothetical protein